MPNVNLGPAALITPQTEAVLAPQNSGTSGGVPQGLAALRLIGFIKGMSLSGTGDVATIQIINANPWAPVTVSFGNALVNGVTGSIAAANLGIFTAAAAGGTVIRTAGVLTGMTGSTVYLTAGAAAAAAALAITTQTLFVNQTVAVAGGTVDVYIYGYDLSPYAP
jgi:hypothetical protein